MAVFGGRWIEWQKCRVSSHSQCVIVYLGLDTLMFFVIVEQMLDCFTRTQNPILSIDDLPGISSITLIIGVP